MDKAIIAKIAGVIVWSVGVFFIGAYWGRIRSESRKLGDYLKMSEEFFKDHSGKLEQVLTRIEEMKGQNMPNEKARAFSFYLPAILIVINIILTLVIIFHK